MNPPRLLSSARGKRTALIAELETNIGGIIVGDIHLEWLARDNYKLKQLTQVLEAIDQAFPETTMPTLLVGDFNYSSIFSGNGLKKFAGKHGFQMGDSFNTHRFFGLPH